MRQLPPSSTLFPYTTLFRSGDAAAVDDAPFYRPCVHRDLSRSTRGKRWHGVLRDTHHPARIDDALPRAVGGESHGGAKRSEDRKSTRLNSSHSSISYAVFCL